MKMKGGEWFNKKNDFKRTAFMDNQSLRFL